VVSTLYVMQAILNSIHFATVVWECGEGQTIHSVYSIQSIHFASATPDAECDKRAASDWRLLRAWRAGERSPDEGP